MRPRPVGRRGADLLFHQPRVALGELARRELLARARQRLELDLVVAARRAAHLDEEHGIARGARDLLRAHVERRVAIQEPRPVLALAGGGLLVRHHGDRAHILAMLDDVRAAGPWRGDAAVRRSACGSRTSRARPTDSPAACTPRPRDSRAAAPEPMQHPLPVALVRGHSSTGLPGASTRARQLRCSPVVTRRRESLRAAIVAALMISTQHLREAAVEALHRPRAAPASSRSGKALARFSRTTCCR